MEFTLENEILTVTVTTSGAQAGRSGGLGPARTHPVPLRRPSAGRENDRQGPAF